MAGALGNSQLAMLLSQAQGAGQLNGLSQGNGNADSLTSHVASLSKQQLYEIMLQMKALIQQNQQEARQLLVGNPQLTKALFQAQIRLGMVKPSQGGATVQSNQQAQAQRSLNQQTNSALPQQVIPQLQAQVRPAAGVASQSIQEPLLQPSSDQSRQSLSQMRYQGSFPQVHSAMAYQQHGQLSRQPLTQQAHQQMAASNLANSASRVGGEMGGGALLSQVGVSGNTGMLGAAMGPQAGRGGLTSGNMHHRSHGRGNIGHLGGSHLPGSASLSGGMGMSMGGGLMTSDVSRIAYESAGERVHAGNGYGQGQLQAMQSSQLQAHAHRQLHSQAQAQSQSQVEIELEQQKALLQQVLNLTPNQINQLPMEQRQQVLQLQQALR